MDRRLEHHVRDAAGRRQVWCLPVAMDRPHEERLAKRTGDDETSSFGVSGVIPPHEADLKPSRPLLRRGDDAVAVRERQRHRFLEQHVLAVG